MSRNGDGAGARGAAPLPGADATVTIGRRWLFVGAIVVEAIVLVVLWLVGRYFTSS
jgi:hypothetical protein